MIRQDYKEMLNAKSVIREMFTYATEKGKEIGYENVFDYSLGNPSVPAPKEFTDTMIKLLQETDPVKLHGYSPSPGIPSVRAAIAESLNKRFGMNYTANHIFMATGAAGAVAHAVRCVTNTNDKVLTFAPFFPEYMHYINDTGAVLKVVPPNLENFQINFEAFEEMLTCDVQAVLINTPNNPSGAACSSDTLKKLADILYKKQEEYGHDIFIISDEPYREIVFDGADAPYVSKFYDNTLSCYSYSKSLSLPGERIGYTLVSPRNEDYDDLTAAIVLSNRTLGSVNAPAIWQRVIEKSLNAKVDVSNYEHRRNLLYSNIIDAGFDAVKPNGALYIFMNTPEGLTDDKFSEICASKNLLLVKGSSFSRPGYCRLAFCVSESTIRNSRKAFFAIAEELGLSHRASL